MALLIHGGQVLRGDPPALERADVLVEGDRIAAVGARLSRPPVAADVDAGGFLVVPGLVNAHTHAHNNLIKSMEDGWTLELFL